MAADVFVDAAITLLNIANSTLYGPPVKQSKRRRQVPIVQAQALECLGHAIEYLVDESLKDHTEGKAGYRADGRLDAIEILMALSRGVYYDCPIIPSFRQRVRGFLMD